MAELNHQPWDDGALRFLSELNRQQTIKTYCGKRVPFVRADEREPITCSECVAAIERRDAAHRRILTYAATEIATQKAAAIRKAEGVKRG